MLLAIPTLSSPHVAATSRPFLPPHSAASSCPLVPLLLPVLFPPRAAAASLPLAASHPMFLPITDDGAGSVPVECPYCQKRESGGQRLASKLCERGNGSLTRSRKALEGLRGEGEQLALGGGLVMVTSGFGLGGSRACQGKLETGGRPGFGRDVGCGRWERLCGSQPQPSTGRSMDKSREEQEALA